MTRELFLVENIDFRSLILQGFYIGVVITFTIGFIAQGINYCLKLFKS